MTEVDYGADILDSRDIIARLEELESWPGNHIDWAAAVSDLQQGYTSAELYGVTYWAR